MTVYPIATAWGPAQDVLAPTGQDEVVGRSGAGPRGTFAREQYFVPRGSSPPFEIRELEPKARSRHMERVTGGPALFRSLKDRGERT